LAMQGLGNGLSSAEKYEDALSVQEAELGTLLRIGGSEYDMLVAQGNLAITYEELGRLEEALCLRQKVYSAHLKIDGEENHDTLREANNYASLLKRVKHFGEAKSLMCKMIPVARRVLGDSHGYTLTMRKVYADALYKADGATLDDLREAVTILEDTTRIARRVLGGAHPVTNGIEAALREARATLHARVSPEELRAAARGVEIN